MATNNFLTFTPTNTGTNLLTQGEYAAAADRTNGNQPGVASSKLNNKAIRQANMIASQLAQYIANKTGLDMLDVDGGEAAILAALLAGFAPNDSFAMENLALASSVASSALAVEVKTQDAGNPASTDVVYIGFRNSTLITGTFNRRAVTAALSLIVPSGATLGQLDGITTNLYIYALDNAGTVELAIAGETFVFPANGIVSTTILNTSSDSNNVMYSTTARSNVPAVLLGVLNNAQATAGTWASAGNSIKLAGDQAPRTNDSALVGVADGSVPGIGKLGQEIISIVDLASPVNCPPSAEFGDLTTITLTAGRFEVYGSISWIRNGATFTQIDLETEIITATGNSTVGTITGYNKINQSLVWSNTSFSVGTVAVGPIRVYCDGSNITVAGTKTAGTTLRLKGLAASYTSGTPQFSGFIRAVRV